jgi:hypothetical protein
MPTDPTLMQLKAALQALALPADKQLLLLPEFVHEVDELALSFEHALKLFQADRRRRLTGKHRQSLREVERVLDGMSGQRNAHLWTRASLRGDESWSRLREAARKALRSFDWKLEVPPGRLFEYIEW